MASVAVTSANTNKLGTSRTVVRNSSGIPYIVLITSGGDIQVWKGNSATPTSFTEQDTSGGPSNANYALPVCAIDATGVIHIAYLNLTGTASTLRYVTFSTSTDTFSGDAQITTLDTAPSNPSLSIAVNADNIPHVAYTDGIQATGTPTTDTYYFNAKSTSNWTSSANMIDGNTATNATTSTDGTTETLTGNTYVSGNSDAITKVEVRVYANGDGDDSIVLTPYFGGASAGNAHSVTPASSAGYSAYQDITTDPNAPSTWTWADIVALDMHVQYTKSGKASTMNCARVEIRVTHASTVVNDTVYYSNRIGGSWGTPVQVEGSGASKVCAFPSIEVDFDNVPVISYSNITDGDVGTARGSTPSTTINNPTGFELFDIHSSASGKTLRSSIAIDPRDGSVQVAYEAGEDTADEKLYIRKHVYDVAWSTWATEETVDATWASTTNESVPISLFIDVTAGRYILAEDPETNDIVYYTDTTGSWASAVTLETGTYNHAVAKGGYWAKYDSIGALFNTPLVRRTTNVANDATSWGSCPASNVSGWKSVDITALYNAWKAGTYTNYGLAIYPSVTSNANNGSIDTRDGGVHIPYIDVDGTTVEVTDDTNYRSSSLTSYAFTFGLKATIGSGGWGDTYIDYFWFDLSSVPAGATQVLFWYYQNASTNDMVASIRRLTADWYGAPPRINNPANEIDYVFIDETASPDVQFNTLALTSSATSVSITKSLQYAIVRAISPLTKALTYHIITTPTAITKALAYAIKTSTAITKSVQYAIKASMVATKNMMYTIVTTATPLTKSLQYAISVVASGITKSVQYTIKAPVLIQKAMQYAISNSASAITKGVQYAIRSSSAVNKSLSYVIAQAVSITKSISYALKSTTALQKTLQYMVISTTAGITKSLQYTVRVSNAITKGLEYVIKLVPRITKSLSYAIRRTTSATKSLTYTIFTASSIAKSIAYRIRTTHAITKSLQYVVSATASAITKSMTYAIRLTGTIQKSMLYVISATATPVTKQLQYAVHFTASAVSKGLTYAIATTATAITKSIQYAINSKTAITKSLTYVIGGGAKIVKALAYTVRTTTALTKSLAYTIVVVGAITKSTTYYIRRITPLTKSLQYVIHATASAITKGMQYVIRTTSAITKGLTYAITITATGITKGVQYAVLTTTTIQKGLEYAIMATPSAITKSIQYAVHATAPVIQKSMQYVVQYTASGLIQRSLQYVIHATASAITKSVQYTILTTAPVITKSMQYVVEVTTFSTITKAMAYFIRLTIPATKALQYVVRGTTALTKALQYVVVGSNTVTKAVTYAMKSTASMTKSMLYTIAQSTAVTKALQYGVKTNALIQTSMRYVVSGAGITLTKSSQYAVKTTRFGQMALEYVVHQRTGITKSMTYEIKRCWPYTDETKPFTPTVPSPIVFRIKPYTKRSAVTTASAKPYRKFEDC